MAITHHLEEQTLFAYAAGTLPEAFNLIVASHISMCDDCRAVVESYDALGGAVLAEGACVAMSDDSLSRALAGLDAVEQEQPALPVVSTFPQPLLEYVGGDLDAVAWRSIGMGVKQAILNTSKEATARLLRIPAGVEIPDHSHDGIEMVLVLQGAFHDEDDTFARGDVEVADGSVSHTPVAAEGEDCICLAVTEAPLKFKGFIPKVAQKLARI